MINTALKIKELRKQLGMNMSELAELAGIGQSTLSYIESSERSPSLEVLEKICTALGITMSDFFRENDEPPSFPPNLQKLISAAKDLPPEYVAKIIDFAFFMRSMLDLKLVEQDLKKSE